MLDIPMARRRGCLAAAALLVSGVCCAAPSRGAEPLDSGRSIFDFGRDTPAVPSSQPSPGPASTAQQPDVKAARPTMPGVPAIARPRGSAPRVDAPTVVERPTVAPRQPLPTPDEQAAAQKLIHEVFRQQYANRAATPAAQLTLAAELLKQANDPGNSPAAQFVLLRDAADFSARAGDARTSSDAITAAARRYRLLPQEELKVRTGEMMLVAHAATDPELLKEIAAGVAGPG